MKALRKRTRKIVVLSLRVQVKSKLKLNQVTNFYKLLGKTKRGKGSSTDQKIRRLEKNRESARESRKRKKNYINSLESKVATLESELNKLRHTIHGMQEKEKISYFSHLTSMD